MSDFDFSVVIPAFNEQKRIGYTLDLLSQFLKTTYFADNRLSYEILVVDDGSTDETSNVVLESADKIQNLRLLSYPENQGKGYAVKFGVTNASGKKVLITDADGSTPFPEFIKLYEISKREKVAIVVGSRAINDGGVVLKTSLHRKILGRLFSLFVRGILGIKIWDTQCGFKLFDRDVIDKICKLQTVHGFGFDPELLFIAGKLNYSVREVPVNWSNTAGSKVNLVIDSTKMFLDLIAIRIKDFRGLYG